MEILILDYKLVQSEHAPQMFDLIRTVTRTKRKTDPSEEDETYNAEIFDSYGMSIEHCIEKIIFFELGKNHETLTLKEFLSEYRKTKEQILNLLN